MLWVSNLNITLRKALFKVKVQHICMTIATTRYINWISVGWFPRKPFHSSRLCILFTHRTMVCTYQNWFKYCTKCVQESTHIRTHSLKFIQYSEKHSVGLAKMAKIKLIINTSEIIKEKGKMRTWKMSFLESQTFKVLKDFL